MPTAIKVVGIYQPISFMSKKKKTKKKSNPTLIAIFMLVLIGWLWQTYLQPSIAGNSRHKTEIAVTDSLEMVVLPPSLESEILHYPGFTVSFNHKHHVPNYVAWTLTGDEARGGEVDKRTDNFAPDLAVKGCPTLDDYRGSGYDRGHMAPAGDMKWSKDAMNACFLLTNMTPQAHTLNQGAWRTLEEKCREWARRDSAVVVICGPILTDPVKKRIGDTKVTVPKRFFKVVLAPTLSPPQGIGFIMPNGPVAGGMQAAAVSIDSVEAVTGFDFFSVLPDDIESMVEAECNFPRMARK